MVVKMRRLALISAVCAVTVVAGSVSASGAVTRPSTTPASFCGGTAAIPMAALKSQVNLSNCPIQGRLVIRDVAGAQIGVHVPPPGHTEGGVATTKSGDYILAVTNKNGHVTATASFPAVQAKSLPPKSNLTPAATDPACNELAVGYLGFVWDETLKWYYNESTASRAGLDGPTTLAAIRAANSNLTTGQNNCGWPSGSGTFGSYIGGVALGAYQGTTTLYANINSAAQCTSKFPDGQNTVSWGPFDSAHDGYLAYTCYDFHTTGDNFAIEADTYLGSNSYIYTTEPANCDADYDLETVMTHEWGHAYGLDEETTDPDEVMYAYIVDCGNRRHLGWGDYEGMANLYGT
jgi:hypothetical protein